MSNGVEQISFCCFFAGKTESLKYLFFILFVSTGLHCNNENNENVLNGKVINIIDGDTFDLLADGKRYRVRLLAIDCPERMQHFYQQSKDALTRLCFQKSVRIEIAYRDRFQRLVSTVFVNRININQKMIADGFAWHFVRYSDDEYLASLEEEARHKKIGIWSHPESVAPWEFRDPHRKVTDLGY